MKKLSLILALAGAAGAVVRFDRAKDEKEWKFSPVSLAAEFKGYDLDKAGNPTFRSAGEGVALSDAWAPVAGAKPSLSRTLKANGEKPLVVMLARDLAVTGPADGAYELAGGLLVRSVSGPALQADAAAKTITLTLKPGETAVLGYSFR